MGTKTIEVADEILDLLRASRLKDRPEADQVKAVLAIHLYLEEVISIGKAAQLAGQNRVEFELLLVDMGLPVVRYDLADYQQDLRTIERLEERRRDS